MFRGSRLCWTQRRSPLCPAGDAIQPPADGTTDFPLFLHPPDELHPLRPAQLPVPSAGTSEAGQPSSRPFRHGRGRAAAPVPPGIRVRLVRKPACPRWREHVGLWAPRRFVVACVPWRGGGETPARVQRLCADGAGVAASPAGPVRAESSAWRGEAAEAQAARCRWWSWTRVPPRLPGAQQATARRSPCSSRPHSPRAALLARLISATAP